MLPRPSNHRRTARLITTAAVALSATLLAGCATFTDSRTAARVGDVRLSLDELDELIVASTPGATAGQRIEVPLGVAQSSLNAWILTEIIRADLEAAGLAVTDADRERARADLERFNGPQWADTTPEPLVDLQVEQQAVIVTWSEMDVPVPTTEELQAQYERGPRRSGIACVSHILVETEDEASEIVTALDRGASFAALAAERSLDPGSAGIGGALACASANEFAGTYIPEFVEAAFEASVGEPTAPVESEFGWHLILIRPFDEAIDEGIDEIAISDPVRFRRAARTADVHVDPRYGAFDPDAGVVTLG